MLRNLPRRRSGFTLIEMMITVAIIGILSAIAVPAFTDYQNRSRRSESLSNVGAIARLEQSYFAEFNTLVPIPVPQPGGGAPDTHKRPWTPAADLAFSQLGWRPEGAVYHDYDVNVNPACRGCFTVSAYGDANGNGLLSLVQYVQPNPDMTAWLPSNAEPAADIPRNDGGLPIFNSVALNRAADPY